MKLTIGHLYPELLNLYGDRGNIICMVQRLKWRGIDAEVKEFDLNDKIDFSKLDIVLLGGGSDREQLLVCNRLKRIKKGFENHGGRTFIEDYQPLGKVLSGHGNNDKDKGEGIVYKNVIGTYLHGPLLPKNPHLCDYLLQTALNRRFGEVELPELDDKDELAANHYIVKRFAQSE